MFENLTDKIRSHAAAEYPRESCGFIVDGDYIPVPNSSDTPNETFRVDNRYWMEYGVKAQGFVHSHPEWYPVPSENDMRQQIASALPWGIIGIKENGAGGYVFSNVEWFGDGVPTLPLKERGFRHGITDCYSGIRDWFKIKKRIILKEIPRSWEWWQDGGDLYSDNFGPVGFVRVPEDEIKREGPREGDVFLASIRSNVLNHGGVYTGNGLGFHHLTAVEAYDLSRLSREEPINRWLPYIRLWVRYNGETS